MSIKFAGLLVSTALSASIGSAGATTLFQTIPDFAAHYSAVYASDVGLGYRLFDTFSLSSPANITDIWFNVQTAYFMDAGTSVSVWSVASGGIPGAPFFSQTVAPADVLSRTDNAPGTSTLEVSLTGLSLAAGSYDISFYNPQVLGVPTYSGGGGNAYWSGPGPDANRFVGDTIGFALCTGGPCVLSSPPAAPEPSTWVMMILGFAGLGLARRATKLRSALQN